MMAYVYGFLPNQNAAAKAAGLACAWLVQSGYDLEVWRQIGAAHVFDTQSPGLLAAALDLLSALDSTPDGRQAIADLLGQPVLEQPKSE